MFEALDTLGPQYENKIYIQKIEGSINCIFFFYFFD